MLTLAYIGLSVLGCAYIAIASFLGHFDFGSHDGGHITSATGHDHTSVYGLDSGGHGTATAGDAGAASFHFPFFSPLALATLFASIGGYGLITKHGFDLSDGASLLLAVPAAFVTAYL